MAKAVPLSSTSVLVVYTRQSDGALRAVVLSVSGSTITVNTAVTLVMGSTALSHFSIALIDSTRVIVGRSNSPGGYDFMVVTISGTTVTANTVYTHATVGNPSLAAPYLAALSSTGLPSSIVTDGPCSAQQQTVLGDGAVGVWHNDHAACRAARPDPSVRPVRRSPALHARRVVIAGCVRPATERGWRLLRPWSTTSLAACSPLSVESRHPRRTRWSVWLSASTFRA